MKAPRFRTRFARTEADLRAVERLRYDVFVEELGGDGADVDHAARRERDRFDPGAAHIMLEDNRRPGACIGTARLRRDGGFYTSGEFDISPLAASGRPLVEIGRSCLHRDYRGGAALWHLWSAVSAHLQATPDAVIFGVASFHTTNAARLSQPLSLLHHHHRAPAALRPVAREAATWELLAPERIDRRAALLAMPPLIRSYLRAGAMTGEGAFVDRDFRCTDVCVVLEAEALVRGLKPLARIA